MIFGGWRGILCGEGNRKRFYTEGTKNTEVTESRLLARYVFMLRGFGGAQELLVQVGDFFVEVSESGFERLAMIGICCGIEVVRNPDAG